jgi:hypothetical protein
MRLARVFRSLTPEGALAMSDDREEPTTSEAVVMAVGSLAMCTSLLLLIASFW